MAKREIKGTEFTRCEAFWDANEGEQFTGVLIDINERFPDKLKGKDAVKPLYILKSLGVKGEKPTLSLDEKPVKNEKGLVVGVFDNKELSDKIFGHYQELLGCEVTLSYVRKETIETSSGTRSIKRFTVMADDQKHGEFGKDAIQRTLGATTGAKGNEGGEVPYDNAATS